MSEFTALSNASRAEHEPWLFLPLDETEFTTYLSRFDQVTAFGFAVCRTDDGSMVGMLNISQIVRGSYQRGLLGYGAFTGSTRQGYMVEALNMALDFAFSALGLHRLEAEIQPGNTASLALVKRLGFLREGLAPELIHIEGVWRDHERWSITRTMFSRPKGSR